MGESESKNEKPKEERRFDPELLKKGLRCDLDQYEMLKRCSDKKDMTERNEWRKENFNERIWLEGAPLKGFYLERVNLQDAELKKANLRQAKVMLRISKILIYAGHIWKVRTSKWHVWTEIL